MTLSDAHRARFGALADVLVPAAEGMPSATEVDIAGTGLDRVLRARPDLEAPLTRAVSTDLKASAEQRVATLQRDDPQAFDAVALTATGGYYTDARIRRLIGYPGQQYDATRITADCSTEDPELRRVIDRGPIYRPTPAAD